MSTENTPNLSLPLMIRNQSGKEVTHNEALVIIDVLLNNGIIDKDLSTPPTSPNKGDTYIVALSATNDWAGNEGKIAFYNNGWRFITPKEGFTVWINDENILYTYTGSSWQASGGSIVSKIEDLTNVEITNPSQYDLIAHDGTNFVNTKDIQVNNLTVSGLTASKIVETNISKKLITTDKNTAYNKNFGIISGTVCEGNDARLSDARTPLAHSLAGAEHSADTLANLNLKISDATLIDTADSRLSNSRKCDNTFDDVLTAKTNLSLNNVDNTSDADKPVSTAQQTALDLKVNNNDARLSDARTPLSHSLAGAEHNSDTLANLNLKVSDATLIDTNDSRLSNSRKCDNTFDNILTTKTNLLLNNVDNTSDADKPVSTAQQTALNLKANNDEVVKLSSNQSISGEKNFSTGIKIANSNLLSGVSTGTLNNDKIATQGYVDDNTGSTFDQDLNTTNSPQFAGLTVDNINIDGNKIKTTDVFGSLILEKPAGSGIMGFGEPTTFPIISKFIYADSAPTISYCLTSDMDYPVFTKYLTGHDNIKLGFDARDTVSTDAGSNYQIAKVGDKFNINYNSGTAKGGVITWKNGIELDTLGNCILGNSSDSLDRTLTIKSNKSVTLKLEADIDNITETEHPAIQMLQDGGSVIGKLGLDSNNDIYLENQYSAGNLLLKTNSLGRLKIDSNGRITKPYQPTFSVYNNQNRSNITGDGTSYTVPYNVEIKDIGGYYNNTTGVFTAPVDGFYSFTFSVVLEGFTSSHTSFRWELITSNRTYYTPYVNPYAMRQTSGFFGDGRSYTNIWMDAGDTAYVNINVSGGTKVISINAANNYNDFQGGLKC